MGKRCRAQADFLARNSAGTLMKFTVTRSRRLIDKLRKKNAILRNVWLNPLERGFRHRREKLSVKCSYLALIKVSKTLEKFKIEREWRSMNKSKDAVKSHGKWKVSSLECEFLCKIILRWGITILLYMFRVFKFNKKSICTYKLNIIFTLKLIM